MKNSLAIIVLSAAIFVLGTAQNIIIAKFVSNEIVADFFYLQSFIMFVVPIGASTILVKNFATYDAGERVFNLGYQIYHLILSLVFSLLSLGYLYLRSDVASVSLVLCLLICVFQSNTSIVSFLRLFSQTYIAALCVRIILLIFKVSLFLLVPSGALSLTHLLLVFLSTDILFGIALLTMMVLMRDKYKISFDLHKTLLAGLRWGSVNAALRNLPRLFIFFLAERFYSDQAVVNLRLFLLPRENLGALMGIVNTAFYKQIFERRKLEVFSVIFVIGLSFQIAFVYAMNIVGMNLDVTLTVIAFYTSVALVYGVTQFQWSMIKHNRENIQLLIIIGSFISMVLLFSFFWFAQTQVELLLYLIVFNLVWSFFVFGTETFYKKARNNRDDIRST